MVKEIIFFICFYTSACQLNLLSWLTVQSKFKIYTTLSVTVYCISCIYVPAGSCNGGDMHKALKGKDSSGRKFLVSLTPST